MPNTVKEERIFEKPVAWLVGRDLLGGIKGMILYTAYGSKLDPRDWMTGRLVDFSAGADNKKEFWFDFLADTGDGTKAMYAIAYMALSDLWAKAPGEPLSADGKREIAFEAETGRDLLPRGEFLFIGGDTAYHVADYLTLANRVQRPFTYAFEDLIEDGRKIPQRPVFGIPGNHDYYDQVDGFRRQFRKPVRAEPPQPPQTPGGEHAQLGIAGFDRKQEASYVALKLPFDWWLWGLDTETGPLDNRQQKFFSSLGDLNEAGEVIAPKKLLIATPSPSTVFGKVADKQNDFKATKALIELLGPDQPFLPKKRNDGTYDFTTTGDALMQSGQCRLDIAGDVHQYARYWGPKPSGGNAAREHAKSATPGAESYASVVSGLGGAFHHPSNTFDDELQEQVLYPTEKASREAVGNQVFDFRSVFTGGYVWLFGFIIALLIYFGLTVTQSSRQFLSHFPPLIYAGLIERETIRPTTARPPRPFDPLTSPAGDSGVPDACKSVRRFALWRTLASRPDWNPPQPCLPNEPCYFFDGSCGTWPKDLIIGQVLIFLSLFAAIGTFFLRDWLFGAKENDPKQGWVDPKPNWKIALITVPTAAAVFLGMVTVEPYREHVTPYVSSLLVLFTMIVGAAAIVITVHYNDYLFKKGHFDYITQSDRFWPWALPIATVLVLAVSLWSFGRNNLPALLVTDVLCTLVFVGSLVGLTLLPITSISGELLYTARPRALQRIGQLLIGIWHCILQLVVPFVLVRRGTWLTWILAAILVMLPTRWAARLFKDNRGLALSLLWVLYGGLMLVLPWLTSPSRISLVSIDSHFYSPFWLGPNGILPSILAGLVGAVTSCLWFGWYLGICSIFNGHNNEVGGAARIEEFKQFIRFRVTENDLTGYVIAVDDVSMIGQTNAKNHTVSGKDLKPKLVDVFQLKVKP